MRTLGKILLACLLVLLGYLLWPQAPSFTQFNPNALVEADFHSWKAQGQGRWLTCWWVTWRMLDVEFRFPALASMRMAYAYTRASAVFARAKSIEEQDKAKVYLRDYYQVLGKKWKTTGDADVLADREFQVWTMAASGTADPKILAAITAEQWADIAGGKTADYRPATTLLATAALIYGSKGPKGTPAAEPYLREGYKNLLEATRKNK